MTKDRFLHRVSDILWSYKDGNNELFTADDCKLLIAEAFDVHIRGMEQEEAEEANASYSDLLREEKKERALNQVQK